ncbi:hypothetical protein ACQJBY_029150 [Aegilops geniculata]
MEGGGGEEAGDDQQVKAVATAGGGTRDRGGSGSGGPRRALAARFRPRPPSKTNRVRRSGVGAKISRYLELVDGAGVGGEAGVGTVPCGGAAHAAGQDGPAASAGQNGAPASAGQAGLGADQDAVEKTSNSTTPSSSPWTTSGSCSSSTLRNMFRSK